MDNVSKILVVDDTPANLKVITEILSRENFKVSVAISGERALKRLESYIPDLILLDIQMPGINGFETCQAIKEMDHIADIPIIFITALSDTSNILKGFSLGAVDYISKPFKDVELLARVKTHLRLHLLNQSLETQIAERTLKLEDTTTQLQTTLDQLQASQLNLIQHEKMSALGNLVAGIAHEINNPLSFLSGNISELEVSLEEITDYIQLYERIYPSPGEEITEKRRQVDLDFLLQDLPKMLSSMEMGCNRLQNISTSLRAFSRSDIASKIEANVHQLLDSTLLLLKYRLQTKNNVRPEIQVIRTYGDLPEIKCFPGQLNQVFMNLFANAIDMFDELAEENSFESLKTRPQQITVQTDCLNDKDIIIKISDNGKGMPTTVSSRIFDRQFTTKVVGKGTGLGLTIAKQIIEEKHGGQITVNSIPDQGTDFIVTLPI